MSLIGDFLDGLDVVESLDAHRALLSRTRRRMGYDGFSYAGMWPTETRHLVPASLAPGVVALTDHRETWVERYLSRGYAGIDPVFRVALGQSLPVVWGPDLLLGERSSEEDAMMRDASEWGIRHGICAVARGCDGTIGMLAMSAAHDPAPDRETICAFHLMAIHLHEALRPRLSPRPNAAARLTARELDVLMWTAQGKTAQDIAAILSISARTVNSHLASVMRKLGVSSKTHAVARLLTSGW